MDSQTLEPPYSIFDKRQKWLIIVVVSTAATFSGFASNIYFPALPTIADELDVSLELVNLTVTTYLIFQGIAPSFLSTQEGLPTFLGVELRGLPAPAGGLLWRAQCRREWEAEYNLFLAEWGDGALMIEELWLDNGDLDERGKEWRRRRVERWVEGLDEYGTMLYAIMQCTHGV